MCPSVAVKWEAPAPAGESDCEMACASCLTQPFSPVARRVPEPVQAPEPMERRREGTNAPGVAGCSGLHPTRRLSMLPWLASADARPSVDKKQQIRRVRATASCCRKRTCASDRTPIRRTSRTSLQPARPLREVEMRHFRLARPSREESPREPTSSEPPRDVSPGTAGLPPRWSVPPPAR